jgi:hypothetical protein
LCGLLSNASLFFKVNKLKMVILEDGRETGGILREDIQLLNPWVPQTKKPYLRFQLASLAGRFKAGRTAEDGWGGAGDCLVDFWEGNSEWVMKIGSRQA